MKKIGYNIKSRIYLLGITTVCFLSACGQQPQKEPAAGETGTVTDTIVTDTIATDTIAATNDTTAREENYFSSYTSRQKDETYQTSGNVHLKDKKTLTMLEATDNAQITVTGKLNPIEGDISLRYQAPDGTVTTLADSSGIADNSTIFINQPLDIPAGNGEIYFTGNCADAMFDIGFSLSDNVRYYYSNTDNCNTDNSTNSMPPRFEINMELTENYDDADPFIDERLFYVTQDMDTLQLNLLYQMKGEEGILEIADNKTDDVLWRSVWHGTVDTATTAAQLKNLETDKEYVIRFTGTKIEYAAITAVSDSDKIQERERPEKTVEESVNPLVSEFDINLTKDRTTFLIVEAEEDTKAVAHYTYTTREEDGAKWGCCLDGGADSAVYELTAGTELVYGMFWTDKTIPLKKGKNIFYISGEGVSCKMHFELKGENLHVYEFAEDA